ncbi:MAG: transposase, partial [Campylobacterota bacterium]|nr:transposase [Campylobacterota bacterium]
MVDEKVSIFSKMVNIFKGNIKNIKDERRQRSDLKYNYSDIILGAFSMLYFQNPSWLSFQKKLQDNNGENNATTIFDIKIPVENHSKKLLDKLKPEVFKKVYDDILLECEQLDIINQFVFMKEYLLVAVDGVQYHSSTKVKCDCCQTKKDSKTGVVTYSHVAITPTLVHPKLKKVIALFQEFITNKDGDEKQDCEVNATKRWLDTFDILKFLKKKYKVIILGDDLYSRYPMIKKILDKGHSFILVCKTTSHKVLYKTIESYKQTNSVKTFTITRIHNGKKQTLTYNWINKILLNGNKEDNIEVNWCELIIVNAQGKQLHCFSFVTDLEITNKNVEEIIEAGRTRWKVENENNNTLKNHGYDLAHNYGHGKEYLSQNICSLNILSFLFHTVQELADKNYIEVRAIVGTRKEFHQTLNMLTTMFVFKSLDKMLEFIIIQRTNGKKVNDM